MDIPRIYHGYTMDIHIPHIYIYIYLPHTHIYTYIYSIHSIHHTCMYTLYIYIYTSYIYTPYISYLRESIYFPISSVHIFRSAPGNRQLCPLEDLWGRWCHRLPPARHGGGYRATGAVGWIYKWKTWGSTWGIYGISMVYLWYIYGISMVYIPSIVVNYTIL